MNDLRDNRRCILDIWHYLQDIDQTQREYAQHVYGEGDEEEEKESVVPSADAVVDPRTVMVEGLKII